MRKLPIFKTDSRVTAIAYKLAASFDRSAWNGQSLAQLTLGNLLPCPLPLVPRENRFTPSLSVPIVHFQTNLKTNSNLSLPWNISGRPTRPDLFHWSVCWHRANLRKGLASSKSRGRVSGGGRKIYRQKGTGRARAGSSRAPQRRGGGVVFGPRPRDFGQKLPRKIRGRAVMSALGMKWRAGRVVVVESGSLELESYKTAELVKILDSHYNQNSDHKKRDKVLIVDTEPFNKNLMLAGRSLSDRLQLFSFSVSKELVCYDILNCQTVVLTDRAVSHLLSFFK